MNSSALLEAFEAELSIEAFGRLGVATCDTLSKRGLPPMLRFADKQAQAPAHLIVDALSIMKATHDPFMIEQGHRRMRANPLNPVGCHRDRVPLSLDENMFTVLPHRMQVVSERVAKSLYVVQSLARDWLDLQRRDARRTFLRKPDHLCSFTSCSRRLNAA